MFQNNHNQKGSAVVYTVLLMFVMMTSSAIILSGVLSRHIRSAQDYLGSERAFSAANTGIEQMLYTVAKSSIAVDVGSVTSHGEIMYNNEPATYDGAGGSILKDNSLIPCMSASGTYRDVVKRIALGEGVPGCTP